MALSINPTYQNGIISTSDEPKYKPDPRGVGYEFFTHLKKYGSKIVQIDPLTGEADTCESVLERSIRVAMKLLEFGVTSNDTISTCSLNHINSCVPIFASFFIGVKSASFDYRMQEKEAVILIEEINPKVIFVDFQSLSFIESILKQSNRTPKIIVFGESQQYINFFDLLEPNPEEHKFKPAEIDEDQTAIIFFTSGSSGMPKGICLSHRVFLEQIAVYLDINEPYDRIWDASTFYWNCCSVYWAVTIIKGGCKILLSSIDDPKLVWDSISTYKPTYFFLTPYELRFIWKFKPDDVCVDSLRTIALAGGALAEHELIKYRNYFSKAKVGSDYGSTETGILLFFQTDTEKSLEFLKKKLKSSGSVLNGLSYKIVDVDTEEILGPYQKGELRIKMKKMFSAYHNSDASEQFDSDGWYKTGDIMYYDEDYYFYFVEKLKTMIKYRGVTVSPKIIEDVLTQLDEISAACVIGIEDSEDDEHLMAVVELKNERVVKDDFKKSVCQYVVKELGDKFVLHGGVEIVEKIPFTPSVKPTYNNGIITTPDEHKYTLDPRGVGYELFTDLKKYASKTVQIDTFTGEADTYESLLQRSIRIALKLLEFGVTQNDMISTCSLNHINSCVPIFASLFIGVKSVSFDHRMQDEEAVVLMKEFIPKIIFVDFVSLSFIESILKQSNTTATIIVFGETSNYINYFDLLLPNPKEDDFKPLEIDAAETAIIFFTSGSSGMPKGVCLTHGAILEQTCVALDINEPYERIWDASTFYWESSIYFWVISIIAGGCKLLLPTSDDAELVWKSINSYNPTYVFLTPYELRWIWKCKPDDINVDSIGTVDIGGGPIREDELVKYKTFFSNAKVSLEYGLTETGMVLAFQNETEKDIEFLNKKLASCGSVLNGVSYKIVDVNTGKVLGPYQKGELYIKMKHMFSGYYNNDTPDEFDSDGWFKTGDILYYDEDYYFYFVERLKVMIKYQSITVSPKIIENVLMSRSDISAACVIGIEDEEDDEHLLAVVELNNICVIEDDFVKDVCRYVEQELGKKFLLNAGVKIVDRIPFTPSTKYDIRKLKLMFQKPKIVQK
ncbi:hypothetical protein RN001_015000 [Aquatica leii]|uniref:Uncharacterized protein n=1 Tax=Aquatica leii TaxID=1421715 RepID=A0AAN7S6G3_9COLE|nr:hypothetical protein RN001_015000 [Aquatica leii]